MQRILFSFGLTALVLSLVCGAYYIKPQIYCDSYIPIDIDQSSPANIYSIKGSLSDCKECPANAICKSKMIIGCKEGHTKTQNTISRYFFLGSFIPHKCVPTLSNTNIIKTAQRIEKILSKRHADYIYQLSSFRNLLYKPKINQELYTIKGKKMQISFWKHKYDEICLSKHHLLAELSNNGINNNHGLDFHNVVREAVLILLEQKIIFSLQYGHQKSYSIKDDKHYVLGSSYPSFSPWQYLWIQTYTFISHNLYLFFKTSAAAILSFVLVFWIIIRHKKKKYITAFVEKSVQEIINVEESFFTTPYNPLNSRRIEDKDLKTKLVHKCKLNNKTIDKLWPEVVPILRKIPGIGCSEYKDEKGDPYLEWEYIF